MRDVMEFARFEALVDAYGAEPRRWPEEERAAAEALARTDPRAARLLADADAIDALLFAHKAAEPSRTLRAMVVEGAPRRRRIGRRMRLWWSGIGFAAAACGVLAGSAATAALDSVTANVQLYQHDELAAYDDVPEENAQ